EVGILSSQRALIDSIPVLKIPNYAFRNNGDLTFSDVSQEWGIVHPSFSNGAAFADLDNDGDLDYVINNINDVAFLYENTLYSEESATYSNNYLRLKVTDIANRRSTAGVKVTIRYDSGKVQYHDHTIYRGHISTVEDVIHFGLGSDLKVDSILIEWPAGNRQALHDIPAGQLLAVDYLEHGVAVPELEVPDLAPPKRLQEI